MGRRKKVRSGEWVRYVQSRPELEKGKKKRCAMSAGDFTAHESELLRVNWHSDDSRSFASYLHLIILFRIALTLVLVLDLLPGSLLVFTHIA